MADTLPRAGTPAAQKGSAVLKHIMLARVDSGFFTYLPYMLQFSAQYKIYQIHMLVCRMIECPYDGMPVIKMPKTVGAMHVCPYSRKTLRARSLDHCVRPRGITRALHGGGSAPLTRRRQPRRGTIPHRPCLPRPTALAFPSQGRRRHNHRHRSDHPGFHQKC